MNALYHCINGTTIRQCEITSLASATLAFARATGNRQLAHVAYQALNGYVYQRRALVRVIGIVRAFAVFGGAS